MRIDPASKPSRERRAHQEQGASPEKLRSASHSRHIPAAVKRDVWLKGGGQCAYVDPQTGHKCLSTHWLQIDHIIPFAKGGPTIPENLRLLCANHNRLEALNHFKNALWLTKGLAR
jgi:5-methylcytosine-specific restriction endonuclease McrA